MTTKERISADIKKNADHKIMGFATDYVKDQIEVDILDKAGELVGGLTNLSSVGTKAGDAEAGQAMQIIEQKIAHKLIILLKLKYHIK